MQGRMYGNEYRTTLVCVDTYDRNEITGRLYNPYLPEGEIFLSLMDFLLRMEYLLDGMQLPQSFMGSRTFGETPPEPTGPPADSTFREGKLGTFAVRVVFRQNASWQGFVSWLEGEQEEKFRSVLELLKIMDSALAADEKKPARSCGA